MAQSKTERLSQQIKADIRYALRLWNELQQPIDAFMTDENRPIGKPRFYVLFDLKPRKQIQGLRIGILSLNLYDEPIINRTLEFAGKVWHLKDKLAKYAVAKKVSIAIDNYVNQRQPLTIVADLANANKHGENQNRSGISPQIKMVRFDTSKSGVLELFLDGAKQEKELLVTFKRPIPYTVELNIAGGAVLGDAVQIIRDALEGWLPLIQKLGILTDNKPDTKYLREQLFHNAKAKTA